MIARRFTAALLAVSALAAACSSDTPDDPAAFCDALTGASANRATIGNIDLDNRDTIDAALAELETLTELAPDDVSADVKLVNEVWDEVLNALADTAPGTRDDVLRELQPRLDEAKPAAAALEEYAAATCSVEFEGAPTPTPTPTPVDVDD